MKKTIVILVIVAILGGVIFGFGYVPLRIQPGEELLMYSRTSGWDDTILRPGEFAWRWQLLIPRNVTFFSVSAQPRRLTVESTSSLPSADLYREYLEGTPILAERVVLRLRYRISEEGIRIIAPAGLDDTGLEEWYRDYDDQLAAVTLDTVRQTMKDVLFDERTLFPSEALVSAVESDIAARFPDIRLEAVILEEISVPDMVLYQLGRETYTAVQNRRKETLEDFAIQSTGTRALQNERLETLARYGEILDRHPILLDYLEIAAKHGADPLDLERLESSVE
jgi:hypothetical protein